MIFSRWKRISPPLLTFLVWFISIEGSNYPPPSGPLAPGRRRPPRITHHVLMMALMGALAVGLLSPEALGNHTRVPLGSEWVFPPSPSSRFPYAQRTTFSRFYAYIITKCYIRNFRKGIRRFLRFEAQLRVLRFC